MTEHIDESGYSLWRRIWVYQQERFPILRFGLMSLAFSFCGICISRLMRSEISWPSLSSAIVAFSCVFLFFLQLRFLDEFKDNEVDKLYRPERPVPRGLVSLKQIGWALMITVVIQTVLVSYLSLWLLILLFAVWCYMVLMTLEFFVADWLKPRLLTYMWTHMLIMPIIDFFVTGCDWLKEGSVPPKGLLVFLLVSFFNGLLVELGRKTWAPEQERHNVDSYSSYCGLNKALMIFCGVMFSAYVCILIVGFQVGFFIPIILLMTLLLIWGVSILKKFSHTRKLTEAKKLEFFSGIWVISSYLIMGIIPLGYAIWQI